MVSDRLTNDDDGEDGDDGDDGEGDARGGGRRWVISEVTVVVTGDRGARLN